MDPNDNILGAEKVRAEDDPPELLALHAYQETHPHRYEPALFFESETGFTGIAGRYVFSTESGHSRFDMEQKTLQLQKLPDFWESPVVREELLDEMRRLEAMNPSLQHLEYDRTKNNDIFDALRGVVSGFSVVDINSYIRADLDEFLEAGKLKDELNPRLIERFGLRGMIQWNPAVETLQNIKTQLGRMPQAGVVAEALARDARSLEKDSPQLRP